jgi:hypothetical protein
MWRRWLVWVAAVLAVPAAIVLVLLAVDVLRVPGELEGDDVSFEAAPLRQEGLWESLGFLPRRPGARLLDMGDDLAYRRTLALWVKVPPGTDIYGPELENMRGKLQSELTGGSAEDLNPKRRSQLLNLLGALSLERRSFDAIESESTLRRAIHIFRSAIEIDPGNEDAKVNLELALRNARAISLPGTDPDAGAAQGSISGQGRAGTGY